MSTFPTRKRSGKHLHQVLRYARYPSKIIGIDGEAVTKEGKHAYILLAAVNGENDKQYIRTSNLDGLPTKHCLDFLLSLSQDAIKVAYSFGYDVNMILKDLEWILIQLLHEGEYIQWGNYRMRYIPRKLFWIKNTETGVSQTIYDTFGFYQMKFVKALQDWKIGDKNEQKEIERMKDQRSIFSLNELDEITAYCLKECLFLTKLTTKLFLSLEEAKLFPSQYSGAGSIAGYLMGKHEIKEYLNDSPALDYMATFSYYGGRFDVASVGHFQNTWSYDINSAYPAECINLPCLAHGEWINADDYRPDYKVALWLIEWCMPDNARWAPFPWRDKNGNIYYTSHGEGWYWQEEIKQGICLIKYYGGSYTIKRGYAYIQECFHAPFSWLPDFYKLRREYQHQENAAEKVMKLGMNSLYGKIAQTVGWRKGSKPSYQSWVWAGLITSGTRARLLEATLINPENVISHATDGIITLQQLDIPNCGEGFGQWKEQKEGELWLIQPGIYEFLDEPTRSIGEIKTRGHFANEIDWSTLTNSWRRDPFSGYYKYSTHRFIGMGTALWRTEFSKVWRTWQDIPLCIYFAPRRRIIGSTKREAKLNERVEWFPRWDKGASLSHHYHHKETWDDQYALMRFEKLLKMEQP